MKKKVFRIITFTLVFLLILPIIPFRNSDAAGVKRSWNRYKEPVLSATGKTLEGRYKTFELTVNNLSTYVKSIKWYTLNGKVATVKAAANGKTATVTATGKGTTQIRCRLTLSNKKTVNLYCKVTVKITAEKIEITNARNDRDYRHVIEVGDKYDFNSKITPGNAPEKTYWFVDNDYYAKVDSKGVVTAKRAGIVTLTAVAALNGKDAAAGSVRDQILIEIADYGNGGSGEGDDCNGNYQPQAKLLTLVRTDKTKLTAAFDRAIQTPGLILVNNNTECIEGKVDLNDPKKVNYTLSSVSAQLTGRKEVSIGYWEGYQVSPDNNSADKLIKVSVDFTVNGINPLPDPVSITQSQTDNNIITLWFSSRLDKASAENISNYSIAGVTITGAELTDSSGAGTVKLTLKPGSIPTTGNYLASINGIKGYDNSYTAMNPYYVSIALKENTAPAVTGLSYTYPVTITFTFNEQVKGTPGFKVLQDNKDFASYSFIDNNKVIIILKEVPVMNKTLQIIPADFNAITDIAGNKVSSSMTRNLTPQKN